MRIAVLFDSDHPQYGGLYGRAIRNSILSTSVIQNSGRHVKVKVGDVLIYSNAKSKADYEQIAEHTYFSHSWQLLLSAKLRATYLKSTVFAWVFQNIDEKTARKLDMVLSSSDDAYLGMHGVDLTNRAHLGLYQNSLIGAYRIKGESCHIFYSMGEEDEKGQNELDELRSLGFTDVDWEDRGAHGTIFDDYDTLEHFLRVEAFRKMVSNLPGGEDGADELVLMLEDLSPRLFSTLGALARVLEIATHEEDLAQVGISARRYIVQLSDVLFPARKGKYKAMDVTKDKCKNRLLAYIDQAIPEEETEKVKQHDRLRKDLDRVLNEVHVAIHGTSNKSRVSKVLSDLVVFSLELLQLNPEMARNPYFAFSKNITEFS